MTFPQRRPYRDWTEQELRDHAQDCTSRTCPSHGRYNSELLARGLSR